MTTDSTTNPASNVPGPKPPTEPRMPPRWLELVLALVAVALASVLCIWMIFYPANAEPRAAQFFLCVAIALYLAVFFFILWPQADLSAEVQSWFAAKPVKVAGPIVLFFVSLGILYGLIPPRETFVSIYPVDGPPERVLFDPLGTKVEYKGQKADDFSSQLICGSGLDYDVLKGIYVRFPPGEQVVKFVFKHHTYEDYEVTLNRGDKVIDLRGLKKKEEER